MMDDHDQPVVVEHDQCRTSRPVSKDYANRKRGLQAGTVPANHLKSKLGPSNVITNKKYRHKSPIDKARTGHCPVGIWHALEVVVCYSFGDSQIPPHMGYTQAQLLQNVNFQLQTQSHYHV